MTSAIPELVERQVASVGFTGGRLYRDHCGGEDAGHGGMNPGEENRIPQQEAQQEIPGQAADAAPVHEIHHQKDRSSGPESQRIYSSRIGHRDDRHGTQIINDGNSGEEQLERRRSPPAEQAEDADGEGYVRRCRNGPSADECR